jgi:catechol 2,3-dioxygenase-like lactoylglutathione lyase family enzyme
VVSVVTATGVHHHGVTVTDLERSVRFYEQVLGAQREWTIDVPAGASTQSPDVSYTVAMLALPGVRVEMFQFDVEGERRYDQRPEDVGNAHLCLVVDDMEAAHAGLVDAGMVIVLPPQISGAGPMEGTHYMKFLDPDGISIELVQLPAG